MFAHAIMFLPLEVGMTIPSFLIIFLLLIFVAVHLYLLYIHHKYSHLPSPKGAGYYIGHMRLLSASFNGEGDFNDIFVKWGNECGPVYVIWIGFKPIVAVSHPEIIKQLATSKHSKPKHDAGINTWNKQRFLGKGIFTKQHYKESTERRRIYDPSFTKNFLNGLVPQYNKIVQKHLVSYLKTVADGRTVIDMKQVIGKVTLEIISEVAFGMNFSEDEYVKSICGSQDILTLVETSLEGIIVQVLNPLLPYIKPSVGKKYIDSVATLREIGRYSIKKRIKLIENKEECPQDILTQIITLSQNEDNKLGLEDLVDDFVTFYAAGQETTANNILFTLVEVLQSPDLYQRCQVEVDEVIGESDEIDVAKLNKLEFIQAVLEESLRLHPILARVEKTTREEIVTNDYKIPKDTRVWTLPYITQRSPEYFDNPLQFDPSRFEPGQKRPNPYVYFPFGIGHRICIGRAFAMIESKIIFALLLKHFKLMLTEGYEMNKVCRTVSKLTDMTCYAELK